MTADDLKRSAIALLGSPIGWQSGVARLLRVGPLDVEYWISLGIIPAWVDQEIRKLTALRDSYRLPTDRWLIGHTPAADCGGPRYIARLTEPLFVARIIKTEADGRPTLEECPVSTGEGEVRMIDQTTALCEIEWLSEVSSWDEVCLLGVACDLVLTAKGT